MRSATLIVAAVSSLSLAAPSLAQQRGWQGRGATPGASFPRTAIPAARLNPPRQAGGWKPQPGAPRPGGWKPGTPPQGGWKPGTPGKPGGWQPGAPGRPGGWQPGRPGGWQPGQPGKPGGWQPGRPGKPGGWQPGRPGAQKPGWRWGEKYQGRWRGGWNAPGGWGAYRRPVRGWTLPSYWVSGGFWISDWSNWGLNSPPYGYNWVRYYDDAVLVDQYGRVWDSVSGVDWDRGDGYDDDGREYADEDGYGADYDAPDYADAPPPPPGYAPPPPGYAAPMRCVANCYGAPGYGYYGGPVTTTVVIQSAPVVTTTTVTEEVVTYGGRKVVRRVPTKQLYRAPARVKTKTCYCR